MDTKKLELLAQAHAEKINSRPVEELMDDFREFTEGKQDHFSSGKIDKQTFDAMLAVLELDSLDGSQVIDFSVIDDLYIRVESARYRRSAFPNGPLEIHEALNAIADSQDIWTDNVNDYKATMRIQYDDEMVVALGVESTSIIVTCKECVAAEEIDEVMANNNQEFSCAHCDDEYRYSYWIGAYDVSRLIQTTSWHTWEIGYEGHVQTAPEKKGVVGGRLALSELEPGDLVTVIAKDNSSHRPKPDVTSGFIVTETGEEPKGFLVVWEDGVVKKSSVTLVGSGKMQTARQNPMIRGADRFCIAYGSLIVGDEIVLRDPKPGAEFTVLEQGRIAHIDVTTLGHEELASLLNDLKLTTPVDATQAK